MDWTWHAPEGRKLYMENPRRRTRRNPQILADRLRRAMPAGLRAPWTEPVVFLAHPEVLFGAREIGTDAVWHDILGFASVGRSLTWERHS